MSLEPLLKKHASEMVVANNFNAVALRTAYGVIGTSLAGAGVYFNAALGEVFHQTINTVSNLAGGALSSVRDQVDNLANPRPEKRSKAVALYEPTRGPIAKRRQKVSRMPKPKRQGITETDAPVTTKRKSVLRRKGNRKRGGRLYRRNNLKKF